MVWGINSSRKKEYRGTCDMKRIKMLIFSMVHTFLNWHIYYTWTWRPINGWYKLYEIKCDTCGREFHLR